MHVKVGKLLLSKHTAAYYEDGPVALFKEVIAGCLLCVTGNVTWRGEKERSYTQRAKHGQVMS